MKLIVAIPTYNGRHLLEATLASYFDQTVPPDLVVVVDDGSTDDTLAWLAAEWPQVQVIAHGRNRGITIALNTCLAAGLQAEYVGLFNNDVELSRTALAELCSALDARADLAAAGPKMLNYYDRQLVDGAGDFYCWTGTAHRRGHGQRDTGQFDTAEEFFGVCGGAAVLRTEALEQVGLFDEKFGAYYEDVDWSLRANLAGWRCAYQPAAVVFHMSSATTGYGLRPFSAYHVWRNTLWIVAKSWTWREILIHLPVLLFAQAWITLVAARSGLLGVLLRAWRDALRGWPAMRGQRRARAPGAHLELPLTVTRPTFVRGSGR